MHRSKFDLCHHHIIVFTIFIYSADSFFFTTLFAFGFASVPATTAFLTLEMRFKRALIFFFDLVTPKEPIVLFPLADFLSPLPISN
jgi:hypothetical protein